MGAGDIYGWGPLYGGDIFVVKDQVFSEMRKIILSNLPISP